MPKLFKIQRGPDGLKEVEASLRAEPDSKSQKRLMAIRLGLMGNHSSQEIAEVVGVSRRGFWDWIKKFEVGGIKGLLECHYEKRGKKARLGSQDLEDLVEGLKQGRWKRGKEIQSWLKSQREVSLGIKSIYYWLGKLGGVLKVPRKTHLRKNAAEGQRFKEELAQKLESFPMEGKKVRIWVADEHRYGLISTVRKCWTLRGQRPTAPYHTKFQWGYLYSALEVDGENRAEAFFSPCVNLDVSRMFLQQIADSDKQAQHIVIWDQAGFHQKAMDETLPDRIHILSLPAYSPELNPVEKIGDFIKDRTSNAVWNTLKDIESAIEEELRPIWQQPQRVKNLIGNGWLLAQTNFSALNNSALII